MSLNRSNIQDLKPGFRLGEDLFSETGILLAKKNQMIDERMLKTLKSFGLTQVFLAEDSTNREHPLNDEQTKEIQIRVMERFKNLNLKSPVVEKIYQFCVQRGVSNPSRMSVTSRTSEI